MLNRCIEYQPVSSFLEAVQRLTSRTDVSVTCLERISLQLDVLKPSIRGAEKSADFNSIN